MMMNMLVRQPKSKKSQEKKLHSHTFFFVVLRRKNRNIKLWWSVGWKKKKMFHAPRKKTGKNPIFSLRLFLHYFCRLRILLEAADQVRRRCPAALEKGGWPNAKRVLPFEGETRNATVVIITDCSSTYHHQAFQVKEHPANFRTSEATHKNLAGRWLTQFCIKAVPYSARGKKVCFLPFFFPPPLLLPPFLQSSSLTF